ncbi:MAG: precorrin-2 C(20)-methyltransferase [Spirochaetaceae bacterium]|jgi:precorrin-2/cobalt-factor-2 C20-methyltransferase|nr:precorrin-2 C(20)-methyltransferase [Spirochaetaceae bacterium]
MKKGILYGVSVGPGDPELITVKALKTIAACDYVAFIDPGKGRKAAAFEIARAAAPEIERKKLIRLAIPMTNDAALMRESHCEAFNIISGRLREGANTAFLTLGDVSVYSTFGYLRELATASGFETRMISGVPSFCAAAAALNSDLALGEKNLHIFYASESNLDAFLELKGTRVFMKGPSSIPLIIKKIKEKGLRASLVSNCGMENELIIKQPCEPACGHDAGAGDTGALGYYTLIIAGDEA